MGIRKLSLNQFPLNADKLIGILMKILNDADYSVQRELMKITENIGRKNGYGYVFDDWDDEYPWMMIFNPNDST